MRQTKPFLSLEETLDLFGVKESDLLGESKSELPILCFEQKLVLKGKDKRPDSDYDPKQLAKGMKVEKEHTDDEEIAKKVAKDHIDEIPDYYERLDKLEKSAKLGEDRIDEAMSFGDFFTKVKEAEKLSSDAYLSLNNLKHEMDSWGSHEGLADFDKHQSSVYTQLSKAIQASVNAKQEAHQLYSMIKKMK